MAELRAAALLWLLDVVPAGHAATGPAPLGSTLPEAAEWVAPLSFALALLATTVLLFAAARGRRRRGPGDPHRPRQGRGG